MHKALVTGSAGFIGQHLVRVLREQEDEVLEMDQVYGTEHDLRLHASEELLNDLVGKTDVVYHLAGNADKGAHSEPLVMRGDIISAKRVLDACCAADKPLVVASSAYALRHNTHYGITKGVIELLVGVYRERGLPVSVARIFNVYGPGQEHAITYHSVVTLNLIRAFSRGEYVVRTKQSRDFVYINDVIAGLKEAMRRTMMVSPGDDYELGSGQLSSILELGEIIAQSMGYKGPVAFEERGDYQVRPYERPAEPILPPQFSLEEGIGLTVEHFR